MTWDGIPEHRNLPGDGDEPKSPADYLRNLFGGPPRSPRSLPMPDDPFSGISAGATATHEMFRAHVEAGFTEQQALFYLGCLMQVGLAIQQGGLLPPPQEPGQI
jgi:hypothetical protein